MNSETMTPGVSRFPALPWIAACTEIFLPFWEVPPTFLRPDPEGWQSGLSYLTRNQACPKGYRGFESHPLRQPSPSLRLAGQLIMSYIGNDGRCPGD